MLKTRCLYSPIYRASIINRFPEVSSISDILCKAESSQTKGDSGNLSAVLCKQNSLKLIDRPIPEPDDDEVLLKMGCVGICGSDVHYWSKGRIGKFILTNPMVIGHEGSGTVVKLGSKVTSLSVGDRVAIEPGIPCRKCATCKTGKYNLCQDVVFCATPPYDGNLARYYKHPADFCYKLPDNVSLEEGAMLEPFSVGVHACRLGGVKLGSVVLVLGAGPIGLLTTMAAKAMSASTVIVTDQVGHRLEMASKCGADITLLVEPKETEQCTTKRILESACRLPDVTIDCAGFQATAALGIEATKPGGKYIPVGMGAEEVTIPMVNVTIKEIELLGSFRYCNDYPLALEIVSKGKANIKQLVTHNFKLEETQKAFETALSGEGNPIKIMMHCN